MPSMEKIEKFMPRNGNKQLKEVPGETNLLSWNLNQYAKALCNVLSHTKTNSFSKEGHIKKAHTRNIKLKRTFANEQYRTIKSEIKSEKNFVDNKYYNWHDLNLNMAKSSSFHGGDPTNSLGKLHINSSQIKKIDPKARSECATNDRPLKSEGDKKLSLKPWRIVTESDKDQNRENIGPMDADEFRKFDDFDMIKEPTKVHIRMNKKDWFRGDSQPDTTEPNRFYQDPKKILASLYDDFNVIEKNQ